MLSGVGTFAATTNGMPKVCMSLAGLSLVISVAGCSPKLKPLLPAAEIIVMDTGINLANRLGPDPQFYQVTGTSIRSNLRSKWVVDDDPFQVNQFLHPYQGSMYHSIARSTGYNYWQSMAYTFAGSAMWEVFGETTRPSKNDQIATGIGGTFLGEPLFRMSRVLLTPHDRSPGFWRVLGATIISPPAGVNHLMFGDKITSEVPTSGAVSDLRLQIGAAGSVTEKLGDHDSTKLNHPIAGFSIDYGFPGSRNYSHPKPFDYFTMGATASWADGIETVTTRGFLAGRDYGAGDRGRGIWGVYGNYDYFTSAPFRFSTTAVSAGTTAQINLSDAVAFQTSALAGIGYSSAQSVEATLDRDYHYGFGPHALLAAKLIAGKRAAIDVTARGIYLGGVGAIDKGERDRILRIESSAAVRLFGPNAISVKYTRSERHASLTGFPRLIQTGSTVGVYYTILGSRGFGAIR
jgi:hypothetical protein